MYMLDSPSIILPKKRPLLKKILHGDEYLHNKEREYNKDKGTRGWQIWFYNWQGGVIKRFCFDEESNAIELFIEIHTPGFDPRKYNIPPEEIGHIQLFITQALTSNPGSSQNFTIPDTWGPNTTSCIGAGAPGGVGGTGFTGNFFLRGGTGGGGGAFASGNVQGINRNGTCPYIIGAVTTAIGSGTSGSSCFNGTSLGSCSVGAQGGSFNNVPNGGSTLPAAAICLGGKAANSVGSIKRNGGDGGPGGGLSNVTNGGSTGGGGGAAGGPSSDGGTGSAGSSAGGDASFVNGGSGGDSDTASGGAASASSNPGGNGTDFDGTHGAGAAGSGAGKSGLAAINGGNGGNFGGGGGGLNNIVNGGPNSVGNGKQGMIWLSWVPYAYSEIYQTN